MTRVVRYCLLFMAGCLAATACSLPQVNTTRLGSVDLVAMTDRMAVSLINQPQVAQRTPESQPWIVTIDRVVNKTNDYLPESERWAFVARLRALLTANQTLARRNIRFVVPAQQDQPDELINRATPTHALTATFHALTVADRRIRSDAYLCAYQLMDLRTDRVVWEDRYEVKYAVKRNKFD